MERYNNRSKLMWSPQLTLSRVKSFSALINLSMCEYRTRSLTLIFRARIIKILVYTQYTCSWNNQCEKFQYEAIVAINKLWNNIICSTSISRAKLRRDIPSCKGNSSNLLSYSILRNSSYHAHNFLTELVSHHKSTWEWFENSEMSFQMLHITLRIFGTQSR